MGLERVMWPTAAPEKLANLLPGGDGGGDTETSLLYRNFRCLRFFWHLGRLHPAMLTDTSLSTRGIFQPRRPWPLKHHQPPAEWVTVSSPATCGTRTTSWGCESAARINASPLPRGKEMAALRADTCQVDSLEWIKWKGFGVIPDGVCDIFHATVCEL